MKGQLLRKGWSADGLSRALQCHLELKGTIRAPSVRSNFVVKVKTFRGPNNYSLDDDDDDDVDKERDENKVTHFKG